MRLFNNCLDFKSKSTAIILLPKCEKRSEFAYSDIFCLTHIRHNLFIIISYSRERQAVSEASDTV